MKLKPLVALKRMKTKLSRPCRKLMQVFKFRFRFRFRLRLKKPICIKCLRFRRRRPLRGCRPKRNKTRHRHRKSRIRRFFSCFRRRSSPIQAEELDEVTELRSMPLTDGGGQVDRVKLFPSPLTPAYVRLNGSDKRKVVGEEDYVDDACRSFETYLVEMIVEERKLDDLMDVEELLYCWKNLKCPVFRDMVCRFYGELCTDLFYCEEEEEETIDEDFK